MMRFAVAFPAMLSLVGIGMETANGQTLTQIDAKAVQILKEHPDQAILIVDAMMRDEKGNVMGCSTTTLSLAGTERKVVRIRTHLGSLFGRSDEDGGVAQIEPGLYLVAGITASWRDPTYTAATSRKSRYAPGKSFRRARSSSTTRRRVRLSHEAFPATRMSITDPRHCIPEGACAIDVCQGQKSPLILLTDREKKEGLTAPKQ
jgi:hypothetical protein